MEVKDYQKMQVQEENTSKEAIGRSIDIMERIQENIMYLKMALGQ